MRLADCFTPSFQLVQGMLSGRGREHGERRSAVLRSIEEGIARAAAEFTPRTLRGARRLVALWVDNRLSGDAWHGRSAWLDNPLLSPPPREYETHLLDFAGRLRDDDREDSQMALLMLECLGRGFNLDGPCSCGLLGLLAGRFKPAP